jgi:hypothetical protein
MISILKNEVTGFFEEADMYYGEPIEMYAALNEGGYLATSTVSPDGLFENEEDAQEYVDKYLPEFCTGKFTVEPVLYRPAAIQKKPKQWEPA